MTRLAPREVGLIAAALALAVDQGCKLFFAGPLDPVDDQSAGGGFVDGPKP